MFTQTICCIPLSSSKNLVVIGWVDILVEIPEPVQVQQAPEKSIPIPSILIQARILGVLVLYLVRLYLQVLETTMIFPKFIGDSKTIKQTRVGTLFPTLQAYLIGPCSWCWPMFKLLNIFESDPQSVRAHFPNFTFGYCLAGGKNHLITHLIQLGLNPYVCNYLLSVLVTTKP